ncbi:MAG: CPBP family intramembrane metalloprotease [Phormidesmis priestleyi]|uniref:CPBP family intramembrane metalloprotease n=1 Tax=Phormidesmis priestleyi TaxID=268141 RepID=A0A2W4ZSP3_9CYAN|nr:MAG: CPBP family intramembrane metalloprotease [Phormidesmis priestleyi]
MAVTAVFLLVVARIWLLIEPARLPIAIAWKDAGIGLAIGLAIVALSGLIYWVWPAYRRSADFYLAFVLKPLVLWDIIWLGLLPGMSEELLFRGVMLPSIGLNATGLIVSSLCFGVLHMSSPQQWPYAVWAGCVGLILGGSFLVTGNLLVPIVGHVAANAFSGLFWQIRQRQQEAIRR